jgi:hypothetical protein
MTVTIRTYLCNKKLLAMQVDGAAKKEISVSDGLVKAYLSPVGNDPRKCMGYTSVVGENTNFINCIKDVPVLSWVRELIGLEADPRLSRYITVKANIPDLPCHWKVAIVYTINLSPADHHIVFISRLDTTGGLIPDSKAAANPLKTGLDFEVTERTLVPGELLQLAWTIVIDDTVYSAPVMGCWYALPLITGGKVISKEEDSYVVRVQNVNLVCLPTDWAQYQIGDWVFVLKPGFDGTLKEKQDPSDPDEYEPYIDETKEYSSSSITQPIYGDTGYRVLPMIVDLFGNAGGVFEKKEMVTATPEELDKAFKTTRHIGTITAIDRDTEKATVVIEDSLLTGSFADVPIFYHCPEQTTVAGGSDAFTEDDHVIVLNEGGGPVASIDDLTIIGFPEELRPCEGDYILCVSERIWQTSWAPEDIEHPDAGMAFVWNVTLGRLHEVVDEFDNPVEQPMNFVRLKYLLELPANGLIDIWREEPAQTTSWSGACGSYTRYPQTNELLPVGYEVEPVGLFTKAYTVNYLQDCSAPISLTQIISGQPAWYFNKAAGGESPWEAFYEIRQRTTFQNVAYTQNFAHSKLIDIPDSELVAGGMDLIVMDPASPPTGTTTLLALKPIRPCDYGVAPALHEWVRCSGDPDTVEYRKGPYLGIKESCCKGESLAYMLCRPSECVDNFDDAEYEWSGLKENENGSWDWSTWWVQDDPWPCTSGYRRLLGMGCGIKETEEIAVYFELCHFQWCNEDTTFKKFNLYYQFADDVNGYRLSRFSAAPNMPELRDLIFSFQYPVNVSGNNLFFKGEKVLPTSEKRPVFSLHKAIAPATT